MKKYLLFLTVSLTLLFFGDVKAQDGDRWIYVTSDGDYNFDAFYDIETLKYNNNSITVNIKFVYNSESKEFWNRKYSIMKYVYYCNEYQYQFKTETTYYRNGEMSSHNINKIEDVIPDSVSETFYKLFCK